MVVGCVCVCLCVVAGQRKGKRAAPQKAEHTHKTPPQKKLSPNAPPHTQNNAPERAQLVQVDAAVVVRIEARKHAGDVGGLRLGQAVFGGVKAVQLLGALQRQVGRQRRERVARHGAVGGGERAQRGEDRLERLGMGCF